jgi:hypothetical protein
VERKPRQRWGKFAIFYAAVVMAGRYKDSEVGREQVQYHVQQKYEALLYIIR